MNVGLKKNYKEIRRYIKFILGNKTVLKYSYTNSTKTKLDYTVTTGKFGVFFINVSNSVSNMITSCFSIYIYMHCYSENTAPLDG